MPRRERLPRRATRMQRCGCNYLQTPPQSEAARCVPQLTACRLRARWALQLPNVAVCSAAAGNVALPSVIVHLACKCCLRVLQVVASEAEVAAEAPIPAAVPEGEAAPVEAATPVEAPPAAAAELEAAGEVEVDGQAAAATVALAGAEPEPAVAMEADEGEADVSAGGVGGWEAVQLHVMHSCKSERQAVRNNKSFMRCAPEAAATRM